MKARWLAAGTLAAITASATLVLALPAGAHEAEGPPEVNCDEASVELKGFPQNGPHEIRFVITVNGTESVKTTELNGSSGTVSVSISDLTSATGPLDIEAFAEWDADGGGESDTTTLEDEVCHETPPEDTTPTSVGGATATRTEVPAAAAAVSAEPRFTG
jgi:hypothetical protein